MSETHSPDISDSLDRLAAENDPDAMDRLIHVDLKIKNPDEIARFLRFLRWMLKHLMPRVMRSRGKMEWIAFEIDDAAWVAWCTFLEDNERSSILTELSLVQPNVYKNLFVFHYCEESLVAVTKLHNDLVVSYGRQFASPETAPYRRATADEKKKWLEMYKQSVATTVEGGAAPKAAEGAKTQQ